MRRSIYSIQPLTAPLKTSRSVMVVEGQDRGLSLSAE
jgi:hypothetical protein